jgi:hypothetical protein
MDAYRECAGNVRTLEFLDGHGGNRHVTYLDIALLYLLRHRLRDQAIAVAPASNWEASDCVGSSSSGDTWSQWCRN